MSRRLPFCRLAGLLLTAAVLGGCDTLHYYGQAVSGQASLLLQRQPLEEVLTDGAVDDATRQQLELVREVLGFARQELALEPGGSYRGYVELDRGFVAWNVFAAPPFSLEPKQWCYPVAGCLGYRGYFSADAAERFAGRLREQGHDVYVGGVSAYSTLGWFDDPVLSTMLNRPPHRLVAVLMHEMAHQTVFLPGDTRFNEGYASLVEREGLRQWLAARGEEQRFQRFLRESRREEAFVELVQTHRQRLERLYQSERPPGEMRRRKQAIQDSLRRSYRELSASWDSDPYAGWFEGPLNNAQLSTVSAYHDLVPAFARLLRQSDCRWPVFHQRVRELSELEPAAREAALEELGEDADARSGCSGPEPGGQRSSASRVSSASSVSRTNSR